MLRQRNMRAVGCRQSAKLHIFICRWSSSVEFGFRDYYNLIQLRHGVSQNTNLSYCVTICRTMRSQSTNFTDWQTDGRHARSMTATCCATWQLVALKRRFNWLYGVLHGSPNDSQMFWSYSSSNTDLISLPVLSNSFLGTGLMAGFLRG